MQTGEQQLNQFVVANRIEKAEKLVAAWSALVIEKNGNPLTSKSVRVFEKLTDAQRYRLWHDRAKVRCPSNDTWELAYQQLVGKLSAIEQAALRLSYVPAGSDIETTEPREQVAPDDVAAIATRDSSTWSEP
jgi:hypothetical protein